MDNDFISTKEAAERSGFTDGYIRKLIYRGAIKGRKIGRDWIVEPESVNVYMASVRKPGPKPVDR